MKVYAIFRTCGGYDPALQGVSDTKEHADQQIESVLRDLAINWYGCEGEDEIKDHMDSERHNYYTQEVELYQGEK